MIPSVIPTANNFLMQKTANAVRAKFAQTAFAVKYLS